MNVSIRGKMLATGVITLLGLGVWLTPAAQASQGPAHQGQPMSPVPTAQAVRPDTTYPYKFSRIAWTGSDEVIAATDSHGDLYYFWQASGTTTWHKQLVAAGTSTLAYSKPSITAAGTTVYIAAVNGAGDLYYFTKTGTAAWHGTLLSTGGSGKFQAPSITSGDGYVLISAGNTAGELDTFTLAPGGTSWAEQTAASGLFGPSQVTTVFDNLDGAYLGLLTASSGGTLYFWYEYLAEPGWNQQTVASPGSAGSYTGGSVTASTSDIVIAAASTTGAVDAFTQPIGGTGWTEQNVSTTGSYSSPQIAWTGPVSGTTSYDVITAASSTGALDYWWVADGSGLTWNPEIVAKKTTTAVYAAPSIAITSSSVVLTAINTKPGNVMYWYQPFGTNPWNKQTVATG